MHIDNVGEFEELVRDINGPLLIFFVTRWTKNAIDWGKINQYKKNINIVSIDVDNTPELVAKHRLFMTPSMIVYEDGFQRSGLNGFSPLYVEDIVKYYGVKQ